MTPIHIREMRDGDQPLLHRIDDAAARLFATVPVREIAAIAEKPPVPFESFAPILSGGPVLVACDAEDRPIGFAAALELPDCLYLRELSVHPDWQRKGAGSLLLAGFVDRARQSGLKSCALSTFRQVPFNAPFYRRRGFVDLSLPEAPPELQARFHEELAEGSDPELRLLMIRLL